MRIIPFLFLALTFFYGYSEKPDPEKAEFMQLVKTRTIMFDNYSASLEKKSGFFGNRTKNDIKDSQQKLMEIVQIDNKIMNMLNRRLGFRNFEKQNMTEDILTMQQKVMNLSVVNDTLTNKLSACEEENKSNLSKLNKHKFYIFLLVITLLLLFFYVARKYVRSL